MASDLIIHDGTPLGLLYPPDKGRGFERGYGAPMYASADAATPFPASLRVHRADWQARIAEMEATKTRLSDLMDQAGLPCKDQARTNYCWANATTHTDEIVRVLQGEPVVILSAASVAAPITNFRNVGGYGPDALDWIASNGVVPESLWPANAIDSRYDTAEAKAAALNYRCTARWSLDMSTQDDLISCLLRRIPVAVGLSWWSHEVTYYDPLWLDGAIAVRARNSWGMSYGTRGYFTLQGNRMWPSDAVAPAVALAA